MEALTLLPRKEKENNRELAYRILRFNIMSLTLPPGATLNENEIAEQLSISRTPVHEALITLKAEYLVDILPQSGSFVSYISLRNIQEGLFMRSTLEPAIYKQLCGNTPMEYLQRMEENLKAAANITVHHEQIETASQGAEAPGFSESADPGCAAGIDSGYTTGIDRSHTDQLIKLDDQFHKLAYFAAQKPVLWNAMRTVCSHFQRIRYQGSLLMKQDLTCIHNEHSQLYDYLLLGGLPDFDIDEYYQVHLSYFKTYFSRLLKENPQYFKYE